jgi:predicted RND superfamily exporter protein
MVIITLAIFRYFKKHKIIFYSILLLSTAIFGYFASKIKFEENLSKLLPPTKKGGAEELVFSNLKVKDKVFILFTPNREDMDPDELIELSDNFVLKLLEKDTVNKVIDNVFYNIEEDLFENAVTFLYENVAAYIDTAQYAQLDSLLTKEQISLQMEENYATLRSPAGMAFRKVIAQDPIALRNLFLSEMSGMSNGLGGNYTIYNNHIFTADTTILLAFISPNFSSFDSQKAIELIDMIEGEVVSFQENNPDVEILYHGAPVQSVLNSRQIKTDLLVTVSISLLIIVIILMFCFRNISTIPYLILPVAYGVIFAMAVIYLLQGSMSLMAIGIGAIVMGVAFSYCLHVITHFKYVNDAERVLKDETNAVLIGTLTTIGAFVGLLFTQSELLKDFGLFATLGMLGTTFFSLVFMPQFFNPKKNKKSEKAFALIEKINSYPIEKHKWLILIIAVVSIVSFFLSDNVKLDSDLRNIGYHEARAEKSRLLLANKTAGDMSTIYFAAVSNDLDSALYCGNKLLEKLDELKVGELIADYSAPFSIFIPLDEQQRRIDHWQNYWTEEKIEQLRENINEAGAKYKFTDKTFAPFFAMLETGYEPVSLFEAEILPKGFADNIIEQNDDRYLVFVPVKMNRDNLMAVGDAVVAESSSFLVIDPNYYTNDMVKVIHNDFNVTLTISSLFVLIILLISYRSILIALIAFLPMGLSWYIMLGFMALMDMDFNLLNIVISTFIFGVGVDYSIFIMDGLLSEYRTKNPLLKYHKTAVFLSALILIIVIASLLFAEHPVMMSIGVATLIGMTATILIAYTLLPYLFYFVVTGRVAKGKAPLSLTNIFFGEKNKLPIYQLKNNYLYSGNDVEPLLKSELKATHNFALLSIFSEENSSMLEYGCGFGFMSYWAAINNKNMKVVGFDAKEYPITLAENRYLKTDSILFTTETSVLKSSYDILVINKDQATATDEEIKTLIENAKVVFIRKEFFDKYKQYLIDSKFDTRQSDTLFEVYSCR